MGTRAKLAKRALETDMPVMVQASSLGFSALWNRNLLFFFLLVFGWSGNEVRDLVYSVCGVLDSRILIFPSHLFKVAAKRLNLCSLSFFYVTSGKWPLFPIDICNSELRASRTVVLFGSRMLYFEFFNWILLPLQIQELMRGTTEAISLAQVWLAESLYHSVCADCLLDFLMHLFFMLTQLENTFSKFSRWSSFCN